MLKLVMVLVLRLLLVLLLPLLLLLVLLLLLFHLLLHLLLMLLLFQRVATVGGMWGCHPRKDPPSGEDQHRDGKYQAAEERRSGHHLKAA